MAKDRKTGWQWISERAGILAVGCALLMSFLAALIKLMPPASRWIPFWLFVFAALFLIGVIASFNQQRLSANQARDQNEMLGKIAEAVGATQAEVADTTAETKRQIVELQVKISEESKPVVIIRFNVDGEKDPTALPTVENVGKSAATNVKIEDISVPGTKGPGQFDEIDALQPGDSRKVIFDSPDEGPMFGVDLIRYLHTGLENLPPFDWSKVKTQEDARDLFEPMKMPISAVYTDPATGKVYRSEHELEFTFGQHASVIFQRQTEIT